MIKEITQLSIKKTENSLKKWAEEPRDVSPKKVSRWPTGA